jgi:hypothetical protein
MSALTTPTKSDKREKKKKRNEQKETLTSDRKPNKGKEQDHLKKTSLGPLRQGQRLDTSETKQSSSKERKPPNQSSTDHISQAFTFHFQILIWYMKCLCDKKELRPLHKIKQEG